MKKTVHYTLLALAASMLPSSLWAQDATPTPTLVAFDFRCASGVDPLSLMVNGDFEFEGRIGATPPGWTGGSSGLSGTLVQQLFNGAPEQFVTLQNGASIAQKPQPNAGQDRFNTNFYILRFCANVINGELTVVFAGQSFTLNNGSTQFETAPIRADLGEAGETPPVIFTYNGAGVAFIDNVELLPDLRPRGDETPEPSPTPDMPTPTPSPSPGPSPTPSPTLIPGVPTNTPTPALSANSVQVVADPPMLVLSPDDFIVGSNPKKQIILDIKVIGSNGEEINVTTIDPDATIQFTIDTRGEFENAGRILEQLEAGQERTLQTQRRPLNELETVVFVPGKAFDGTVRVIVDIEYEADVNGSRVTQEIRGVVPIVMRTNRSASMTGATGTFNLMDNLNRGKKPGDRGFRPDQKTNLYFHEVFK